MRRRLATAFAAATIAGAVAATPAAAVMYGQPDGNAHPYVALVTFQDANHIPLWRCTATLISPTVVLSAGHCTGVDPTGARPASAEVFFSQGPMVFGDWAGPGTSCEGKYGYPCRGDASGVPHPSLGWTGSLAGPKGNSHDIGVITLNQPYLGTSGKFGVLPAAGMLDTLAKTRGLQDVSMTVVGYGLQAVKPVQLGATVRMVGTVKVVQLKSALAGGWNVRLSSNPGRYSGGTCFGDSGGPVFYNNTNIVVGVNSFVMNDNCKGSGYAYRVDTASSLAFVKNFLKP